MAQMPVVEEGAEPPPYFPRTLVTRSDGHDQCRGGLAYNDERGAMGTIISV